jgi:hypothetical protein
MLIQQFGIFVHDADGDSGYGRIVGPFSDPEVADSYADDIRRIADMDGLSVECIVLPIMSVRTSHMNIINAVFG